MGVKFEISDKNERLASETDRTLPVIRMKKAFPISSDDLSTLMPIGNLLFETDLE